MPSSSSFRSPNSVEIRNENKTEPEKEIKKHIIHEEIELKEKNWGRSLRYCLESFMERINCCSEIYERSNFSRRNREIHSRG